MYCYFIKTTFVKNGNSRVNDVSAAMHTCGNHFVFLYNILKSLSHRGKTYFYQKVAFGEILQSKGRCNMYHKSTRRKQWEDKSL